MQDNVAPVQAGPMFDPLMMYADWYIAQPSFGIPRSPHYGTQRLPDRTSIILHRNGEFQVQLWIGDPNSVVPEHVHPNIDALHMYICGDIEFTACGKPELTIQQQAQTRPDGCGIANGYSFRSRPGESHGAVFGPRGGAFIAIQRWIGKPPTSETDDWEDAPAQ